MYVYSTMQLYVKAPDHIAELVRTRALEIKEGISHTVKEKEPVLDTCHDRAVASMTPHTRTIRQKTPYNYTHQLDFLNGVRRPERGTIAAKHIQPPPAALIGTSFHSRSEMESTLNGFAATQGKSIVVAGSTKTRRGLQQVYYKCDRGAINRTVITSASVSRPRA